MVTLHDDGETGSNPVQDFSEAIEIPQRAVTAQDLRSSLDNVQKLWKFMRSLLHSREYCPSHIRWVNHDEGVFMIVRYNEIAKLWGILRGKPDMTHEHLCRAMRYYYRKNIIQPVNKKLVYRFGPATTGWKSSNPNFELSVDR